MSSDDARQDYVVGLVQRINDVLNGEDGAEAATALTMAVACHIVSTTANHKERLDSALAFSKQLLAFLRREDIVAWIKDHTTYFSPGSGVQ
jgi:hypothetical protein